MLDTMTVFLIFPTLYIPWYCRFCRNLVQCIAPAFAKGTHWLWFTLYPSRLFGRATIKHRSGPNHAYTDQLRRWLPSVRAPKSRRTRPVRPATSAENIAAMYSDFNRRTSRRQHPRLRHPYNTSPADDHTHECFMRVMHAGIRAHLVSGGRWNLADSPAPVPLSSRPFGITGASRRNRAGIVHVKRSTQIVMRAGRTLGRSFI